MPNIFKQRETPHAVWWFNGIVVIPLMVFWGSGSWLVFQILHGNPLLAILLFPFWLGIAAFAFFKLHRAGRVRIAISVTTTAAALLAAAFMAVTPP